MFEPHRHRVLQYWPRHIFSSPEPKAHKVVEPASVRRPASSTFSNDFSSEAARPNLFIFHI